MSALSSFSATADQLDTDLAAMDAVDALRCKLLAGGFKPVPVYTCGKQPFGREWGLRAARGEVPEATPDTLNTGILCNGLRVVDIDVDDATVADALVKLVRETLPPGAPMRIRRNSHRALFVFRAERGEPPKVRVQSTNLSNEPNASGKGKPAGLEILGAGQQFVAFGTHPSGVEYEWDEDTAAPLEAYRLDDLPVLTDDALCDFLAAVQPILGVTEGDSRVAQFNVVEHIRFATTTGPAAECRRASIADIRSALAIIPNADVPWDDWKNVLMASWVASGASEEGKAAFLEWSAKSAKHNETTAEAEWTNVSPPDFIGWNHLRIAAKMADPTWMAPSEEFEAEDPPEPGTAERADLDRRAAQQEAGAAIVRGEAEAAQSTRDRLREMFRPKTAAKMRERPAGSWLIEDVLRTSSLALLYGRPGCGKSFLALSWTLHVAAGKPWQGLETTQGVIVYICAEGQNEIERRRNAMCAYYGLDPDDPNFLVVDNAPNFMEREHADVLAEVIREEVGERTVAAVVVDTLVRSMPGGNENAKEDTNKVVANVSKVMRTFPGCGALIVAHEGATAPDRPMGSTGLLADPDTVMRLSRRDNGLGTFEMIKTRGTASGWKVAIGWQVVDVPGELPRLSKIIPGGASNTSLVPLLRRDAPPPKVRKELTGYAAKLWSMIQQLAEKERPLPHGAHYQPHGCGLAVDDVKAAFAEAMDDEPDKETTRNRYRDSRDALVERGLIGWHGKWVWRTAQPEPFASKAGPMARGDLEDLLAAE